jgi:hypothetical protein
MHIYYRLSDGSYPKVRFPNATKVACLNNFLTQFWTALDDKLIIYADNVKDETYKWLIRAVENNNLLNGVENDPAFRTDVVRSQAGSSAASFRLVFDSALELPPEEAVYFVEDDYIHLPGSHRVLEEGLERSHYVTLYNHPDKYIPSSKGGNPLIGEDGAEVTKVFVTKSSYWMATNSTTMTFATRVQFLKEDEAIWRKYTERTYPQDMRIFLELRDKGRTLIQPLPTKSTHCEPAWAAPLHGTGIKNWDHYLVPFNIVFKG